MDRFSKSQRIHDSKRIKKKRNSYWGLLSLASDNDYRLEKRIGMLLHTPKNCSCYMCGNPRRFWKGKDKITMQERKFEDFANCQYNEEPTIDSTWISVNDKIPNDGQAVLYYFDVVGIHSGFYDADDDCFYGSSGFLCGDVTHWKPLYEKD